jgi:hypothetical protein
MARTGVLAASSRASFAEKIRVGIIGANVRYGWGSSAHNSGLERAS